jgi:hypothetical protein
LCEEGNFPWNRAAPLSTRAQQINAVATGLGDGAFSPFDTATALTTEMISLCIGWPVASAGFAPAGPLPNVPTLVIDGAADIRTPLEDADSIRTLIPGAQVLAVPFTGHSAAVSDLTGAEQCATRAIRQYFIGEPVTPCAATDNPFSPTPVAPRNLDRLKATGRKGRIGRTITAALMTASDIRRQIIGDALEAGRLPSRAGGLRGGRVVVRNEVITLFNVIYVPGVRVSGTVPLSSLGRQKLRLNGPKGAHGTLTVTPTTLTGRLDGRRINLTARAASAGETAAEPDYEKLLRYFRLRHAG